ncbi:MAG: YkgJ family cysteine cluster protein [Pseudomonadota bacterium]
MARHMNTNLTELFREYDVLLSSADNAFRRMQEEYPDCVRCRINCSDCCHAFFELFQIEAVYLNYHFIDSLKRKERRETTRKAEKLLVEIEEIKSSFSEPRHLARKIAGSRVRCPLLNKGSCLLYEYRPITCRLYGIPTAINGSGRTCGMSGFEKGKTYPTVNWDMIHERLYALSSDIWGTENHAVPAQVARRLISVPTALLTDYGRLFTKR